MAKAHVYYPREEFSWETKRREAAKHFPTQNPKREGDFASCTCCDRIYYARANDFGPYWTLVRKWQRIKLWRYGARLGT